MHKKIDSLKKENIRQLTNIFSFVMPYKAYFLAGLLGLLLSSLTSLAFPYAMGELLDAATGDSRGSFANFLESVFGQNIPLLRNKINQIGLALIIILLAQGVFSFLRVYYFARVSEQALADIRLALYKNCLLYTSDAADD